MASKFSLFSLLAAFLLIVVLKEAVGNDQATNEPQPVGFELVIKLVRERLALADQVVKNKVSVDKPIDDLPREQLIMEQTMNSVADKPAAFQQFVNTFFVDQMEANKIVQRELRDEKNELASMSAVPDLAPVRDEINRLNGELLHELERLYNQKKLLTAGGGECARNVLPAFWRFLDEQEERREAVKGTTVAASVTLARINAFHRALANLCPPYNNAAQKERNNPFVVVRKATKHIQQKLNTFFERENRQKFHSMRSTKVVDKNVVDPKTQ